MRRVVVYSISPDLMENYGRKMAYFENLERIPAYGERKIKYKTNGSHYKIKFDYSVINYRYSKDTTIYVNSLLFIPFYYQHTHVHQKIYLKKLFH